MTEDLEIQNPDCFGTIKASSAEIIAGTEDNKYTSPKGLADAGIVPGGGVVPVVATGAEVTTGTDNAKFASPKAIKDAGIVAVTLPVKASGAEITTGIDDAKFATAKALADAGINNKLITELIISGSAVTSVIFSGLDGNTYGTYEIEYSIKNAANAWLTLRIEINQDSTSTHYYQQYHNLDNTYNTALRMNNNNVADTTNLCFISGNILIKSILNRLIILNQNYFENGVNQPSLWRTGITSNQAIANITEIKLLADVASGIAIGSIFRLYRRN